jgi:hypothetical protein
LPMQLLELMKTNRLVLYLRLNNSQFYHNLRQ